ncbi:countin-1 [Thecamonas trahens ATCC 50062]|uniref:Countin-1 n=1 Tax=Thecamonas trahens ATCC 50062 TaxID=461836 RepID=A0A0L0DEH4_THETB|nr:countin-1 [Thecamonas trahens ATCC 50062]KNC50600.1 countin-1 [Thecamonas trahens ATCC 50062]|eukprot:XP_013762487.1 countin-1 [Thecamonas trahens ATCC 50062]
MYKTLFVVLVALALAASASAAPTVVSDLGNPTTCELCVEFLSQAENELLQAILQLGIVDSCGDLCGLLPSRLEGTVCDLLCDYIGVTEFVKIIQEHSPDPIYACQLLKQCSINDNAKANMIDFVVAPKVGQQGTTFTFGATFNVTNGPTGAGELALGVQPPQGMPFGDGAVNDGIPNGEHTVTFSLKAQPNEQEPFSAGTYEVEFAVCNGICGATKPHSAVLAVGKGSFRIEQ